MPQVGRQDLPSDLGLGLGLANSATVRQGVGSELTLLGGLFRNFPPPPGVTIRTTLAPSSDPVRSWHCLTN